jgi:hypothetical protein
MTENSNVFSLRQSGIDDPLTDILRSGARRLLAQAIEIEAQTLFPSAPGANRRPVLLLKSGRVHPNPAARTAFLRCGP